MMNANSGHMDLPRLVWNREPGTHHLIYVASDGGQYAGSIRLQEWGPQKGGWIWSGNIPPSFQTRPALPNTGCEDTPLKAALMAERYWFAHKADRK